MGEQRPLFCAEQPCIVRGMACMSRSWHRVAAASSAGDGKRHARFPRPPLLASLSSLSLLSTCGRLRISGAGFSCLFGLFLCPGGDGVLAGGLAVWRSGWSLRGGGVITDPSRANNSVERRGASFCFFGQRSQRGQESRLTE